MVRLLLVLAVVLVAAGCGGDEPSTDDGATVKAMLESGAEVSRAVQPLFSCLPEEPECYRRAGPELVEVVERERAALDRAIAGTDHPCLKEAASLYGESLAAYGEAGRGAAEGDAAAVDAALSKTTELEIAYSEKLGECGFAEGRMAEHSAAGRKVIVELLRVSEELVACQDEACVLQAVRRGKAASTEGIVVTDRTLAELDDETDEFSRCYQQVFQGYREMFQAQRAAFTALENARFAAAEREALRASELATTALEDAAVCLSSAGL